MKKRKKNKHYRLGISSAQSVGDKKVSKFLGELVVNEGSMETVSTDQKLSNLYLVRCRDLRV